MNKRAKFYRSWKVVIILAITAFVLIFTQDILREFVMFSLNVDALTEEFEERIKSEIQEEVSIHTGDLETILDELDDTIITSNEESLDYLVPHIDNLLEFASGNELAEIISIIRLSSCKDAFYIMDIDGVMRYSGDTDTEVFIDLSDNQDALNKYYIMDFTGHVTSGEYYSVEVFESNTSQYIITGTQIQNTNYIIYMVKDKQEALNEEIIMYSDRLKSHYLSGDETLFIVSDDGYIYFHPNENVIGKTVSNTQDPIKANLLEVTEFALENQNGYMIIPYYRTLDVTNTSDKILYLYHIEEMNLIVGFSRTTAVYDYMVEEFTQNNITKTFTVTIPFYLILIGIFALGLKKIREHNNLAIDIVNEEEHLYKTLSDIGEQIILITLQNGDIIYLNSLGQKLIFGDTDFKIVNLDEIIVDEGKHRLLVGEKENIYISVNTTTVSYNGNECELYVIDDITGIVDKERELVAMSLNDELTGLGNRRLMAQDYQDKILPLVRSGENVFLAMIDLDNFKEANDLYGHSYGDDLLQKIAEVFKNTCAKNISIYRVGGDEFAMFASKINKAQCIEILKDMKQKIIELEVNQGLFISFSAGVAEVTLNDNLRRFSDYYEKADRLLYEAKNSGKNQIKI